MINIPLTPFPSQFSSRDTISFYHQRYTCETPERFAAFILLEFSTGIEDHHPHLHSLDSLDFNQW